MLFVYFHIDNSKYNRTFLFHHYFRPRYGSIIRSLYLLHFLEPSWCKCNCLRASLKLERVWKKKVKMGDEVRYLSLREVKRNWRKTRGMRESEMKKIGHLNLAKDFVRYYIKFAFIQQLKLLDQLVI